MIDDSINEENNELEDNSNFNNKKLNVFAFNRNTELDRLSYICRKLHAEAMNSNLWSLRTQTPSPLTFPNFHKFDFSGKINNYNNYFFYIIILFNLI